MVFGLDCILLEDECGSSTEPFPEIILFHAEGTNVEEAANFLVQKIIDNEKWRSHQQRNGHDARDGAFALPHVARGAEGPRRLLLTREDEAGTRRKADCAC